jgi:hypothetical protein
VSDTFAIGKSPGALKRATRQAFIAWLGSLPDEAYVGVGQEDESCPLAEFLRWLVPGCQPHVCTRDWTPWVDDEPWRTLPTWASEVIRVADAKDELTSWSAGTLRAEITRVLGWRFGAESLP